MANTANYLLSSNPPRTCQAVADVCEEIEKFIQNRIMSAGEKISELARQKIRDGAVILTYGWCVPALLFWECCTAS